MLPLHRLLKDTPVVHEYSYVSYRCVAGTHNRKTMLQYCLQYCNIVRPSIRPRALLGCAGVVGGRGAWRYSTRRGTDAAVAVCSRKLCLSEPNEQGTLSRWPRRGRPCHPRGALPPPSRLLHPPRAYDGPPAHVFVCPTTWSSNEFFSPGWGKCTAHAQQHNVFLYLLPALVFLRV